MPQRAVLGKGKTPSIELLLRCAAVGTPDHFRAVSAAGDQCLRVHVLEFGNRAPENSSELVPVPNPYLIYSLEARSTSKYVLSLLTPKRKTNAREHDTCFSLLLTIYQMCVYSDQ